MNKQNLKHGSLNKLLKNYFAISFFVFFISFLLGKLSYSIISNKPMEYDYLIPPFFYALATSGLLVLYYWDKLKDVFILLNNSRVEIPEHLDNINNTKPCKIFQLDEIVSKLEMSGFLITSIDYNKNIIKIRQRLKIFTLGCGAILYFNDSLEDLTVISFSFDYNRKKRMLNFNKKIFEVLEIQN